MLAAYFTIFFFLVAQGLAASEQARASPPAPPPAANGFEELTVGQAVEEALQNNLALFAQRVNLTVVEAARITAALRPNPVLSSGADHLDLLGTGFSEANAAGPPEYSLRIDFPFERARKRQFRMETADYAKRIAEMQLADAVRRLRLDVVLACVDVLEGKAKLRLARDNLNTLEKLVELNQVRLESGAIAALELTRSRVAMMQYATSVKAAELRLATSRTRLLPLLGRRAPRAPVDIVGELQLPPARQGPDFHRLEEIAFASRSDLESLRLEQARSQADLRLQIAQGKVDYSLGAEYRRSQGINGRGNSVGFFLSVPLPVFNKNQGEIARAQAEQEKARRSVQALQNEISSELLAAYQEFEAARNLVAEMEDSLLRPSEEARRITTYVYQSGATTLVDVLDAQRAFNETMLMFYEAQATFLRARATLSGVVGKEVLQ